MTYTNTIKPWKAQPLSSEHEIMDILRGLPDPAPEYIPKHDVKPTNHPIDPNLEKLMADSNLPLVMEIKPGTSDNGLVGVFKPNEYRGKNIQELAEALMSNPDFTDYERSILQELQANLAELPLRYDDGKALKDSPSIHIRLSNTLGDDSFLYVGLRALVRQPGG
jgi:hypothetical protein